MSPDIAERSFEEAIECGLLQHGPGYTSSIPIRRDWVVTLVNVPPDLTPAEADRLAKFSRLLTVE